jgi:ABC-type phosphate/phosphonate transport system substrate-binding protein
MIASLGMYDREEAQPSNDRLWALIREGMRAHGLAAPDALARGAGAYWEAWSAADLEFSQTCGFPFRAHLQGRVTLIGTPDYAVAGCPAGHYRSIFVARADDPRGSLRDFDGAAFAFNDDLSQSGWAGPQSHARALGVSLPPRLRTGGHLASARAVAEGRADIAGIDAVTWDMIVAWDRFATDLKVVGKTDPTPGLPYIAALGADAALMFTIVEAAIRALPQADRAILRLNGLTRIEAADYLAIPTPPSPADLGMPA